jgi:hypothetical protein
MAVKILLTIGAWSTRAGPLLEANVAHVLNPEWPPHARLHEAWQLGRM